MTTRNFRTSLKIAGAALALALASGCATTAQIEEIRSTANEAQRMAQEAQRAAESANSAAQQAASAAQSAQRAAEAAHNCCRELETKVDRAFEDLQRK